MVSVFFQEHVRRGCRCLCSQWAVCFSQPFFSNFTKFHAKISILCDTALVGVHPYTWNQSGGVNEFHRWLSSVLHCSWNQRGDAAVWLRSSLLLLFLRLQMCQFLRSPLLVDFSSLISPDVYGDGIMWSPICVCIWLTVSKISYEGMEALKWQGRNPWINIYNWLTFKHIF